MLDVQSKNNLYPKYVSGLFKINNCLHNLRCKEFCVQTVSFSLKYLGPTLWGKMRPDIRKLPSFDAFKRAIRKEKVKKKYSCIRPENVKNRYYYNYIYGIFLLLSSEKND